MTSGCKKFLDRKPLAATLDDLKQGGIEGQVFGIYSAVKDYDIGQVFRGKAFTISGLTIRRKEVNLLMVPNGLHHLIIFNM
jgi:hypothetical protein